MVHALETTHGLLKKGALLIDIHPSGEPSLIEAHVDGQLLPAGQLVEPNDGVEYVEADEALANVTGRGLFIMEREGFFDFLRHAPNIVELVDHIEAEQWDAYVPKETVSRAMALMGEPGEGKEIILREPVRIARYRSLGK